MSIQNKKIIRMPEAIEMVGLSKSTILRQEKLGRFPKRRRLSSKSTGWLLSEIQDWISSIEIAIPQKNTRLKKH